jgi:alkanesulfonate monooxygenase SsuD/methylene tetrahydromethanopterin reductase-like flavin-dependent oxidoreductase (luciferase family)
MSPSPTQLLSYIAGRTKRIILGTASSSCPGTIPVRVAEQIALLDILSHGRCVFGFGRGAASVEYAGFRVPWKRRGRASSSRQDRRQGADPGGLRLGRRVLQDPADVDPAAADLASRAALLRLVGEPGVGRDHGQARLRPARHHAERVAEGAEDIRRYRDITASVGHTPRPPIISTNISVAESREEAHERAAQYLARKWDSIDAHYHFSDGHLATVKGYEFYGGMAKTYSKMKDEASGKKATDFYVKIQVVGTPDDCIQQIAELHKLTGMDHLVGEFGYGGMPHEEAQLNMRMYRREGHAGATARSGVCRRRRTARRRAPVPCPAPPASSRRREANGMSGPLHGVRIIDCTTS